MSARCLQQWAGGLRFRTTEEGEEELADAEGHLLTTSFDKAEIVKAAEELMVFEGAAVLEIGFGLGYSAEAIQQRRPSSHVIVECSGVVLERLRKWAEGRPGVVVVEGTWQACLPRLGAFDCIFWDASKDREMNEAEMRACEDEAHRALYLEGLREGVFAAFKAAASALHRRGEGRVLNAEGSEFRQWADGFTFTKDRDGNEQLLDVDGSQVMMKWEKPYMEECVRDLAIDSTCDVLEVGFGCGFSAERIQQERPRTHTIIECSEPVLRRLHAWAADKPSVRVVEGTWQATLQDLGVFDCIFFDDWGEPGLAEREMARCTRSEYRQEYDRAFDHEGGSHFEGFVRIALTWHARKGTRLSGFMMRRVEDLEDIDVESNYRYTPVAPPEHCNYFFSDRALVPLFRKLAPARHHQDDVDCGSTRSGGSGCSSGAHSSAWRRCSRSRSPRRHIADAAHRLA
mmetsp:Transcript_7069/g.20078  ORF Transcript_7069/g.20078 Transcript_7069/m.20078 type:complete len:457 (+) Transcript_7069:113-1483(+)